MATRRGGAKSHRCRRAAAGPASRGGRKPRAAGDPRREPRPALPDRFDWTRSSELQPAGVPDREEESETSATDVPGRRRAGPSRAVPPWRGGAWLCSCHCSRRQGVGVTRATAAAAIARTERTPERRRRTPPRGPADHARRGRAMQTSPPAGCSDRAPRVGIYGRGSQRAAWTEWTKSSACPS